MRALPKRTLLQLRLLAHGSLKGGPGLFPSELEAVIADIDRVLKPSLKAKAARSARAAEKKTRKAAHNSETSEIRAEVMKRADGRCECRCGRFFTPADPGEMDHFAGRGKAPQSIENCWLLSSICHREKTGNFPAASHWLLAFICHAKRHSYHAELSRAEARLQFVLTRSPQ